MAILSFRWDDLSESGSAPTHEQARGWVAAAAAGDERACRALFFAHAPPVRRYLRDSLADACLADEATQETFVRAFDRLGELKAPEKLRGWLLGIARRVALEQLRARTGPRRWVSWFLPNADGDDQPFEPASAAESPEERVLLRERCERVSAAMARLSEPKRSALLLRFDHELAYEEIAALMGWSQSKAKVEVHRARLALRAFLAEGGDEE